MDYDFENDALYIYIPCPEFGDGIVRRQLLMTKELFIACYEKWIKDGERMGDLIDRKDVAEKAGKWILLEKEIGLYECSICGHKILRAECNYCPNCGSRMMSDEDKH